MPTISTFYGIKIQMFPDHLPPHFHVNYSGQQARLKIEDFSYLPGGKLSKTAERLVLEWAGLHQAELMANWILCMQKKTPKQIQPLA